MSDYLFALNLSFRLEFLNQSLNQTPSPVLNQSSVFELSFRLSLNQKMF